MNIKLVVMILIVAVVSGLFLWFVFSQRISNTSNIEGEIVDSAEYDFSIDEEIVDSEELNDLEDEYINVSEREIENIKSDNDIQTTNSVIIESPNTGTGEWAIMIAIIVALISFIGVYKRVSKNIV